MARQALAEVADQPSLEAQSLLGSVLEKPRAWIFTHPETVISTDNLNRLNLLLEQRKLGEPLPYLLGHWEFYGFNFEINPHVLIPRPETELIVDLARDWLDHHPPTNPIVDVGTGSGCIAASIASWKPGFDYFATDISFAALQVASRNFVRLGINQQIKVVQSDLLSAFTGQFDLICANLPYIPTATLKELDVARHEPALALDGGTDGLRLIERLLYQSAATLATPGRILIEVEMTQGNAAPQLAAQYFPLARIELIEDLAGLPRVVVIDQ